MKDGQLCLIVFLSEEAASVKDSAEKVKRALEEAERAQTAASSAIQQAAANIQNTNSLLSSVSLSSTCSGLCHPAGNMKVTQLLSLVCLGGVRDGRCRAEAV